MRTRVFLLLLIAVAIVVFFATRLVNNDYVFFAGYTVLQFVVLATAWNILGGYTGYVNFGSAGFFALGAYSSVFLHKYYPLPIPALIVIQPVEPSVGREYIGRVFAICVLGGMGSLPGTVIAAMLVGIVESLTSTFYGPS